MLGWNLYLHGKFVHLHAEKLFHWTGFVSYHTEALVLGGVDKAKVKLRVTAHLQASLLNRARIGLLELCRDERARVACSV